VIVLESSAAVDYIARLEPAEWIAAELECDPDLHAPHVIDIEVAGALRTLVNSRILSSREGRAALDDWAKFDLARYTHLSVLDRIWDLRSTHSAADASFVALAELLDATLVTTDMRLARSHGHRARIVAP
jgi:predicted nucleic acid-binding protein